MNMIARIITTAISASDEWVMTKMIRIMILWTLNQAICKNDERDDDDDRNECK